MKRLIRKLMPASALLWYHRVIALAAALRNGFPSTKMVVIGITGTKGKTSTANFLWSCLTAAGYTTGLISTANIRIGNEASMNTWHMTMPGAPIIQGLLRRMVRAGCEIAIVETTSEGMKQWRHQGIAYDIALFTNLTPEHLQSHGGSFAAYKAMKGKLFASLARSVRKTLRGKPVPKTIIVNHDSPHADYFLHFWAERKLSYGLEAGGDYQALDVRETDNGVAFFVRGIPYMLNIRGAFNAVNALPAIIVAQELGASTEQIQQGLASLSVIPGRMERIECGQPFAVFVDYAHEKESMTAVLTSGRAMAPKPRRVIVLLGAEGGGRDKAKRPIMGELVARLADIAVVSNVDPYEDDPTAIVEDIARSAEQHGMVRGTNLFVIEDRRAGIRKALEGARAGDVVLITGKGAEQSIVIGGIRSVWDDRTVVREELAALLKQGAAA